MARAASKITSDQADRRETAFRAIAGGTVGCAYLSKRRQQGGYKNRLVTDEYIGIYVLRGHGRCFDGQGRPHVVGPGDFIQQLPRERSGLVQDDDLWLEFYIRFPDPLYHALVAMGLHDTRPVLHPGLDAELLERCARLLTDVRQTPQRDLGVVLCRMHELLVTILRLHHQPRVEETARLIDRACAMLARGPERRFDITRLADDLGLSYERFRKVFRQQVGVSPGEYRIRRRIDHAQHLIAQERLTVKEAAYRLGYPDPFAFSKQFKRYTGQSPSAFRESL